MNINTKLKSIPNSNNDSDDSDVEKFETLSKDFNSIRDLLANMQKVNERECKMKINEFVVGFEQNMQVLLSLANLFEQKTIFEIEKKRNSILELISSETIDVNIKLKIVTQKLDELTNVISQTMESIKNKIKGYEDLSIKKIARARNSFLIKIKKFLK
jgi:hypothetical protein